MKSFVVGVVLLVSMVFGIGVGMFAERRRPIPAEEVKFDPDSMSFVRR